MIGCKHTCNGYHFSEVQKKKHCKTFLYICNVKKVISPRAELCGNNNYGLIARWTKYCIILGAIFVAIKLFLKSLLWCQKHRLTRRNLKFSTKGIFLPQEINGAYEAHHQRSKEVCLKLALGMIMTHMKITKLLPHMGYYLCVFFLLTLCSLDTLLTELMGSTPVLLWWGGVSIGNLLYGSLLS